MKMKNLLLLLPAILLALTMTVVGCNNSPTNDNHQTNDAPQMLKYESIDVWGNTYILTITEKTSRAAYTVTKGDSYALTIKQQGQPDKESKGTVSTIKDDGELTMKPTKADSEPFGVSVNDGKMTAITGTITLEDGGKIQAPGAVTPVGSGGDEIIGVGNVGGPFTSIEDMAAWLSEQPANTENTPYTVKLNVSDLGGAASVTGSVGNTLRNNSTKYVNLDLSGSTFTNIVDSAFYSCSNLIGVTISNNVITIGKYAFGDSQLTSVIIGNSVMSIGEYAFQNTQLTSVIIPNSVTYIEGYTFYKCNKLTSVTIPNSVTGIGLAAFNRCESLTSVNIPDSVTEIMSSVFAYTSLTSISIPDSVTYIGSGAFPTVWLNNQPDGVVYAGKVAYKYKGNMPANTSIILLNGIKSITGSAFEGCTNLTSVTIPNSVTSIGSSAFRGCSLTSVTIPESVINIWDRAFENCTSLTSVRFERVDTTFSETFTFVSYDETRSLLAAYYTGGIGTYTRDSDGDVWTRQP